MHLIVDIRQTAPENPIITRYASEWVGLWRERHPGDTVSYLLFREQRCPENGVPIVVPHTHWWKNKKHLTPRNTREIFRCINFSPCDPYDPSIRTVSHVWDNLRTLYPEVETFWQKYERKRGTQRKIHNSQRIVVPSLPIGQEMVEILHTPESRLEVIPFLGFQPGDENSTLTRTLGIDTPYWLYDGTYGSEIDADGLLRGYRDYRELGGTHLLVLAGSIGHEMRAITERIREIGLTQYVKIIGNPDWKSLDTFYSQSAGWIYTGAYYGGGPRVSLAETYRLPMLVSEIPYFDGYQRTLSIHPYHLNTLGQKLRELEKLSGDRETNRRNTEIMKHYERILAEGD